MSAEAQSLQAPSTYLTFHLLRPNHRSFTLKNFRVTGLQARFVVLIALIILFSSFTPYFFGVLNFTNIVVNASVVGVLACSMTLLLVARQIDISVGSAVALSAAVFVIMTEKHSIVIGLIFSLITALLMSTLNIVAVVYLRIDSIIVTLAGLIAFRGLAKVVLEGRSVTIDGWDYIGEHRINAFGLLHVPIPIIIFLVFLMIVYFIMRATKYGSNMYAIGANPESARLSGINLELQVAKSFVLMGVGVFLATIMTVSMVGMAGPTSGQNLEFLALTAVILGGVGLGGGRGNVLGTCLAVLILAVVDNALVLSGVEAFWQEVARGSLLMLAIVFDQLSRKRDKTVRMAI